MLAAEAEGKVVLAGVALVMAGAHWVAGARLAEAGLVATEAAAASPAAVAAVATAAAAGGEEGT